MDLATETTQRAVTAGTFAKVTIDHSSHVTVGSALDAADVPAIDASKLRLERLHLHVWPQAL